MAQDLICVGAIAGAFGVRGDLRIKSFCANPGDIAEYSPLLSEDGAREFELTISRPIKNGLAGRINGVATKEAADALRGTRLYVSRDRLPAPEDDEYYHSDLIGVEVVDTGGTVLGTVRSVMDHGAGDILEVYAPGRKTTALLPFTKEAVPTVDLSTRRIVADPPEGVFD